MLPQASHGVVIANLQLHQVISQEREKTYWKELREELRSELKLRRKTWGYGLTLSRGERDATEVY